MCATTLVLIYLIFFIYVHMSARLYAVCVYVCEQRPEGGIRPLGAGVIGDCEPPKVL